MSGKRGRVAITRVDTLDAAERSQHEAYMRAALAEARRNPQRPFGAVIVDRSSGRLLAAAVNAVQESPILHGETAAIDRCARDHPGVRWEKTTLYTTAEPCPMCAAAIAWTRIGEVVIGTDIDTIARLGVNQIRLSCSAVLRAAPFYSGRLLVGALSAEADQLYRDWAAHLSNPRS